MSARRRIRPPEEISLRIAILVSLPLYALAFLGFSLLPLRAPAARPEGGDLLQVVLGGGRAGEAAPGLPVSEAEQAGRALGAAAPVRSQGNRALLAARGPAALGADGGRLLRVRSGAAAARDEDGLAGAAETGGSVVGVEGSAAEGSEGVAAETGDGEGGLPYGGGAGSARESGRGGSGAPTVLALIRQRIEQERSYPLAARLRGIEGTVTASITVDREGGLSAERILRSSGSAILDRAGLVLLRRVFPVPNDTGSGFNLEVRIAYRLRDGAE